MSRAKRCVIWLAGLVLGLALAAPARAEVPPPVSAVLAVRPLALWDWDEFKKYWKKQLGRTTGVVGVATVVMGIGVLIICTSSKSNKT